MMSPSTITEITFMKAQMKMATSSMIALLKCLKIIIKKTGQVLKFSMKVFHNEEMYQQLVPRYPDDRTIRHS